METSFTAGMLTPRGPWSSPVPRTILIALLLASFAPGLFAQNLLLRVGKVITVDGKELEPGEVLIEDGTITAVGTKVDAEAGVSVVIAPDGVLMPGFVVAQNSSGLTRSNEQVDVVPFVSVLDGVNPASSFWESSLRDGHLTILTMPGDATVIGGMGALLHPSGVTIDDMAENREAGLKISLIPARGRRSRAAHLARLRDALNAAKRTIAKSTQAAGDVEKTGNIEIDMEAMGIQRRTRPLARLLEKDVPAYVACATAGDVVQALRLASDYGIEVRLVCRSGTWRAAKFLGEKKIPVIYDGPFEIEETDPETGEKVTRCIPKIFKEAGVRFAVLPRSSGLGGRYLWYRAASLVRHGFSREEALAAVTAIPAELIGLGKRKGRIAVGYDADLVLLTEDPLSGTAWVDRAMIGGRVVYDRATDPRLAEVLAPGESR